MLSNEIKKKTKIRMVFLGRMKKIIIIIKKGIEIGAGA